MPTVLGDGRSSVGDAPSAWRPRAPRRRRPTTRPAPPRRVHLLCAAPRRSRRRVPSSALRRATTACRARFEVASLLQLSAAPPRLVSTFSRSSRQRRAGRSRAGRRPSSNLARLRRADLQARPLVARSSSTSITWASFVFAFSISEVRLSSTSTPVERPRCTIAAVARRRAHPRAAPLRPAFAVCGPRRRHARQSPRRSRRRQTAPRALKSPSWSPSSRARALRASTRLSRARRQPAAAPRAEADAGRPAAATSAPSARAVVCRRRTPPSPSPPLAVAPMRRARGDGARAPSGFRRGRRSPRRTVRSCARWTASRLAVRRVGTPLDDHASTAASRHLAPRLKRRRRTRARDTVTPTTAARVRPGAGARLGAGSAAQSSRRRVSRAAAMALPTVDACSRAARGARAPTSTHRRRARLRNFAASDAPPPALARAQQPRPSEPRRLRGERGVPSRTWSERGSRRRATSPRGARWMRLAPPSRCNELYAGGARTRSRRSPCVGRGGGRVRRKHRGGTRDAPRMARSSIRAPSPSLQRSAARRALTPVQRAAMVEDIAPTCSRAREPGAAAARRLYRGAATCAHPTPDRGSRSACHPAARAQMRSTSRAPPRTRPRRAATAAALALTARRPQHAARRDWRGCATRARDSVHGAGGRRVGLRRAARRLADMARTPMLRRARARPWAIRAGLRWLTDLSRCCAPAD